jgi:hypothetical protein
VRGGVQSTVIRMILPCNLEANRGQKSNRSWMLGGSGV